MAKQREEWKSVVGLIKIKKGFKCKFSGLLDYVSYS